jgi:hypothetical protein
MPRAPEPAVPDPLDRISIAKDEAEALRLALEDIQAIVWEPKTTFPTVKRKVARVLAAVRERERPS